MGSIRLFLAFAVLMSHAQVWDIDVIPGHVAVQAFFIISGFYMSLILSQKYAKLSISVFYTNRLLRLFPTYLFMLFLSLGVLYALDVSVFTRIDRFQDAVSYNALTAASCIWTNVAVLGQEILFLLGVDTANHTFYWAPDGMASAKAWHYTLVPQAWSLSMELYFYLLAPFILRRRMYWVALLFVLSLGLRLFMVSKGPEYDLFVRRFFPAELCLFLAGALSYSIFGKIREHKRNVSLGLLCGAVLLVVLVLYEQIDQKYSLALLACTISLSMPVIFNLTKDNRIDRFFGNISYPIYMVHFLIIAILEEYIGEYSVFILLPVVLSASLLVYYGIEAPIDRWRQRRVRVVKSAKRPASS